jgi:hypothetical protein
MDDVKTESQQTAERSFRVAGACADFNRSDIIVSCPQLLGLFWKLQSSFSPQIRASESRPCVRMSDSVGDVQDWLLRPLVVSRSRLTLLCDSASHMNLRMRAQLANERLLSPLPTSASHPEALGRKMDQYVNPTAVIARRIFSLH